MSTRISRDDLERDFARMLKSLHCPSCELEYTDWAVSWSDAWCEGRLDLLKVQGKQERDGPCKIRCEMCGERAWVNYFGRSVTSAKGHTADHG